MKKELLGRKIILSLSCVTICFLLFCQFSLADSRRAETPLDLIQIFYDDLLSNKDVSECADVFVDSKSYALDIREKPKQGEGVLSDTALIWKYLRQNKNLFLFSHISPAQTLQSAKIGYLFVPYKFNNKTSLFFDGNMSIIIFAPLSEMGKDGIMKEIMFPIMRGNGADRHRYLLNLSAIRINGIYLIYLDPLFELKKVKNLIEMLGFPSEK